MSTAFLGFRNYFESLVNFCEADDEIDAVHIQVERTRAMSVLGKAIPGLSAAGWDFHMLRYMHMYRALITQWLRNELDTAHFDVVHITTQANALSARDFPRHRRRFSLAVNIDASVANLVRDFGWSKLACTPLRRRERQIFDNSDLIVCRNRWSSESLDADYGVAPSRIHVCRNSVTAVDRIAAHKEDRSESTEVKIAFVGHDFARKGGRELVRIHQESLSAEAELHIFSRNAPATNGLRNVYSHTDTSRNDLLRIHLPEMDLFALPTQLDMHPWAILEALSVGLPVVSTRIAGIPEMVIDGVTGLLSEPGDWALVQENLKRLVRDAGYRRLLSANAIEHVARSYSAEREFPALLAKLKEVGSQANPGSR